jgi:phosphoglycerate dehydrogenase-like enzyme
VKQLKIVVWDNIGNTLLGVRSWDEWDDRTRRDLLRQNPDAREQVQGFREIFTNYNIDLVWLYDTEKHKQGFVQLYEEYSPSLRAMQSIEDLREEIVDADVLIVHKETVPDDVLRSARKLRFIQHFGQDHRGVPVETASELGIPVAATPLENYLVVAEQAWAMILNHLKQLPAIRTHMHERQYGESWGRFPDTLAARDLKLGLLGFGEIARPIARIANAFRTEIIYWDIVRFPELEQEYGLQYVEWDELFQQADILSVQLALNPQTEGIIGQRELSLMKPSSLFLNTARGKLVDQPALVEAIENGTIGSAALEVFAEEPLPEDDPLLDLHARYPSRVTLTPHCGSLAPWTWIQDSQALWFNLKRFLEGGPVSYLVNQTSTPVEKDGNR